jgi:hypothetical protein
MINRLLPVILSTFCIVASSEATVVTLSAGTSGPRVFTSSGQLVTSGLVRIGTLLGDPIDTTFAAIDRVFLEFDRIATTSDSVFFPGAIGGTGSSQHGTPFNQLPVALWIFDGATSSSSVEHALIGVAANPPSVGAPWVFPTHVGSGLDSVTLSTFTLLADGVSPHTPGVVFDQTNSSITLTAIPEPDCVALLVSVGFLLMIRRRQPPTSN